MESLKNWMIDSANILFDDSKNDLRALPRSVRLQILLVLVSFGQLFSVFIYFLIQPLLLVGLASTLPTLV